MWEGKYDEYGNRREMDIAGCAMPMQKIETIDEPASRLKPLGLFDSIEHADNIKIKLIPIPREIMEKNRTNPPPFLEVAVLEAEPIYKTPPPSPLSKGGSIGGVVVDIKLKNFVPSLAEAPSKELGALKERAVRSGFDFIDFWAVDFDYQDGQPFDHHWQAYRTRKDRSLPTVSNHEYDKYPKKGKYTACVKVVDIFGCDTSITVEVEI